MCRSVFESAPPLICRLVMVNDRNFLHIKSSGQPTRLGSAARSFFSLSPRGISPSHSVSTTPTDCPGDPAGSPLPCLPLLLRPLSLLPRSPPRRMFRESSISAPRLPQRPRVSQLPLPRAAAASANLRPRPRRQHHPPVCVCVCACVFVYVCVLTCQRPAAAKRDISPARRLG